MPGHDPLNPLSGLIGRSAELDRLRETVRTGGSLLLTGARGSGRSRLLAAGAHLARAAGHRVVVARGATAAPPLIRQLLLRVRHDLPGLPGRTGRHALALVGLAGGVPPDDEARLLADVFAALNRDRPTVVVADDVDRVPAEPAALLAGLGGPLLLAGDGARIPALLAGAPVIELPPLTDRDALRLLESREHRPVGGRARVEILHRARGNPAALLELGCGGPLQAAFGHEIAGLPEPARRLLLHLAAAQPPADASTVQAAAGPVGDHPWAAAEQIGLTTRHGDVARFTHPLARDAAYRSGTAHERDRAHRNLAAVLTAEPGRRAPHLAAVSSGANRALAADLESAAAAFRARGNLYEAAGALQQAAERSSPASEAARRFLAAAADAGDLGAVDWTLELTAAVRGLTADETLTGAAVAVAARSLSRSGRQHEAWAMVTTAEGSGAAVALGPAIAIASLTGRTEHRRGLTTLLEAAGPATDPLLAALARLVADPAQRGGRELCDDVVVPPPSAQLDDARRFRLGVAGSLAYFEDRPRLAMAFLRAAVDVPAGRRPSPSSAETVAVLVDVLIDAGHWESAERYADTAGPVGMPMAAAHLDSLRAHLYAMRGDTAEAERLLRTTWARLDVEQNRAIHVRLSRSAGAAAHAAGDYQEAYRHLRSAFGADWEPLEIVTAGRGIAELAAAAARTGHRDEARLAVRAVRAQLGPAPTARMRMLLHTADALLADDDERAEHHFRAATTDPAGHQWPYDRAMARLHHGTWLRRARRPRDARPVLTAAADVFTRLGAVPAATAADRELRASGQDAGTGSDSRLSGLTAQERQVAELAARGLRNREIAERLFISVRTVGAHLHSIYPKLGISGRHQLS
ncbi:LuxR C-terminal-related transcriptional regulator [Actinoplanes sp. Pm04-4]|uniref:LuxR C-terminal-related transcriptional regulator n=1 Tax=Paractinoplanes pyxinae TaxID=2997416 RepID=A0ABT4ATS9_9ACTN|nr:LuxR family transcriptional regulator [Actinoplanes pyxinae]MCY1136753.1 LuxR C-terminal-related transcriptional regulator [Actinoplanes pyxinae]